MYNDIDPAMERRLERHAARAEAAKARTVANFWNHVRIGGVNDCWPWLGHLKNDGYGRCVFDGKNMAASRVAYIIVKNPNLSDDLLVRHKCDYRPCCNPNHLEEGTFKDNYEDCLFRGRLHPSRAGWNAPPE